MKKATSILIYTAFGLISIYAVTALFFSLVLGYEIFITAPLALALPPTVISLTATVFCFISKEKQSKTAKTLAFISMLLYLLFTLINVKINILSACMLFSSFCMMAIFIKSITEKHNFLRFITAAGYVFLVVFMIFIGGIAKIFSGFSVNEVIKEIESPNGEYCLELISNSQGALGGNTIVQITEAKKIETVFFTAKKKPRRIYTGKWGEHNTLTVYWKNDNCIVIGDMEYRID